MTEVNWVHDWAEYPIWNRKTRAYDYELRRRTVAMALNDDGSVRVACAVCSPGDNFSKRLGRIKACGYLKSETLSKNYSSLDDVLIAIGNSMRPLDESGKLDKSNPVNHNFYQVDICTPVEACYHRTVNTTVKN